MIFSAIALVVISAAASTLPPSQTATPNVQVAHEPTITSEIFVQKATMANLFEVEVGKLALTRSKDPEVRDFAQKMVKDHSAAGVDLTRLVSAKAYFIPVPLLLDSGHQAKLKKLQQLSASKFDAAYGASMREGHDEALSVFKLASSETLVDPDLRAFAGKMLPTLQIHHELASKLPLVQEK